MDNNRTYFVPNFCNFFIKRASSLTRRGSFSVFRMLLKELLRFAHQEKSGRKAVLEMLPAFLLARILSLFGRNSSAPNGKGLFRYRITRMLLNKAPVNYTAPSRRRPDSAPGTESVCTSWMFPRRAISRRTSALSLRVR